MFSLSELTSTTPITEDQIHALRNRIAIKLNNIFFPTADMEEDAMAGMDYEEMGDVGHKMHTSRTVEALLAWDKRLQEMLENPALRLDVASLVSLYDDPAI